MRFLGSNTRSCVQVEQYHRYIYFLLLASAVSVLTCVLLSNHGFDVAERNNLSSQTAMFGKARRSVSNSDVGMVSEELPQPPQDPCCFINETIFNPNSRNQTNTTHLEYLLALYNCSRRERTQCNPRTTRTLTNGLNTIAEVQQLNRGQKRVAVLISGVLRRFLPKKVVEGIVQPQHANGVDVDMYIHVVNFDVPTHVGRIDSYEYESPIGTILPNISAYRTYVTQLFENAGARVVKFNIDDMQEFLHPWPLADPEQMNLIARRMYEYPASKNNSNSEIGRNVLRRYATAEKQWADAKAHEMSSGFVYNWVLWTREDTAWLLPLQLTWRAFPTDLHASGIVYTRDCLTWANISDKVLLMDHMAADTLLSHLYQDFYNSTSPELASVNAETYINKVIKLHGVTHSIPGTDVLAASDARYERWGNEGPYFCYRKKYMCHEYKFGGKFVNISNRRCNKN